MNFRSAKIVCTLGPASNSSEMIVRLMRAGMDVARLNFSHGTHEDHARTIKRLREASAQLSKPIGILADLQGPKIRTGALKDKQPVQLVTGQRFTISIQSIAGTSEGVSTTYKRMPRDVSRGDRILLGDGLIELRVLSTTSTLGAVQSRQRRTARRAQGHQFARREIADSRRHAKGSRGSGVCAGAGREFRRR